jgi:hypothetical protein
MTPRIASGNRDCQNLIPRIQSGIVVYFSGDSEFCPIGKLISRNCEAIAPSFDVDGGFQVPLNPDFALED